MANIDVMDINEFFDNIRDISGDNYSVTQFYTSTGPDIGEFVSSYKGMERTVKSPYLTDCDLTAIIAAVAKPTSDSNSRINRGGADYRSYLEHTRYQGTAYLMPQGATKGAMHINYSVHDKGLAYHAMSAAAAALHRPIVTYKKTNIKNMSPPEDHIAEQVFHHIEDFMEKRSWRPDLFGVTTPQLKIIDKERRLSVPVFLGKAENGPPRKSQVTFVEFTETGKTILIDGQDCANYTCPIKNSHGEDLELLLYGGSHMSGVREQMVIDEYPSFITPYIERTKLTQKLGKELIGAVREWYFEENIGHQLPLQINWSNDAETNTTFSKGSHAQLQALVSDLFVFSGLTSGETTIMLKPDCMHGLTQVTNSHHTINGCREQYVNFAKAYTSLTYHVSELMKEKFMFTTIKTEFTPSLCFSSNANKAMNQTKGRYTKEVTPLFMDITHPPEIGAMDMMGALKNISDFINQDFNSGFHKECALISLKYLKTNLNGYITHLEGLKEALNR